MPQKLKKTRVTKKHVLHMHRLHRQRRIWFGILAAGLALIQVTYHFQQASAAHVLAYATGISINDLAALTNQQRAANGLSALNLNTQLNNGAQAKANHMIANDYWAHVAPDGTQPWYFFTQAGYGYSAAGENLAYGFDTSNAAMTAWMGSEGHRANVLGAYQDMGFGIANGDHYQGGENTVVVAFYGAPPKSAPEPAPAPAAPVKPAPAAPASATPTEATPAAQPAAPAAPQPEPAAAAPKTTPQPKAPAPAAATQPQKVTNLSSLLNGGASWATIASVGLIGATSLGFAATHWELVHRSWKYSRRYILLHPAIDAAVVTGTLAVILTSTVGFIK